MNTYILDRSKNLHIFYLDGGQSPLISETGSGDVVLDNLFITSLPPANFWKRLVASYKLGREYMTCLNRVAR
jgi:hypothetical protein